MMSLTEIAAFRERVSTERIRLGLSQEEIANQAGVKAC